MDDHLPHDVTSAAPHQIGGIGSKLESGAMRFTTRVARILDDLEDASGTAVSPHRAYAADPRNEPAQPIVERHETAVAAARELLTSLSDGMSTLGRVTTVIGHDLAERDAALATELHHDGGRAD